MQNKPKEVKRSGFNPFLKQQIKEQKERGLELKKTIKVNIENEKK